MREGDKFLLGLLLVIGAVVIASDPRCKALCQSAMRFVAERGFRFLA